MAVEGALKEASLWMVIVDRVVRKLSSLEDIGQTDPARLQTKCQYPCHARL